MENHFSRRYTLAELEPGQPESFTFAKIKSSMRAQGSMKMSLRRVSRMPENSRTYSHGDPIALIDWKAYARTDQLIVREHRDEAAAKIGILIDNSSTLNWPNPEQLAKHGGVEPLPTKFEIAARLGLYLAHAHLTIGDFVTVGFMDDRGDVSRLWSPRRPSDVIAVFDLCKKEGFANGLDPFMEIATWIAHRFDHLWYLSDFLGIGQIVDQMPQMMTMRWREFKKLSLVHIFSFIESHGHWMKNKTSYQDFSREKRIFLGEQLNHAGLWDAAIQQWQAKMALVAKAQGASYLAVDDHTHVGDFFHWLMTEVK